VRAFEGPFLKYLEKYRVWRKTILDQIKLESILYKKDLKWHIREYEKSFLIMFTFNQFIHKFCLMSEWRPSGRS
jgi:hypothetical protein